MAAALETLQALLQTLNEIKELPYNRESCKYFPQLVRIFAEFSIVIHFVDNPLTRNI